MRDYSKVGPKFWIGSTGKRLRSAGMEAQIVSMYLLTSPHANMLGLYYCPVMFIAHETGIGLEGASKGLQRAIEAGFCEYDEASEVVWVMEMASYQVADSLKANDLRVKGVQNEYASIPQNPYLERFYEKYCAAFHMESCRKNTSPLEAPSKPLRSQEQEQEQEQEQKKTTLPGKPADADEKPRKPSFTAEAHEVLEYLNLIAGTKYQPVAANLNLIVGRLRDGFTVDAIKAVIERKHREWGSGDMRKYLRPETLFNATKFAGYAGQDDSSMQDGYNHEALAVIESYNALLGSNGWPEAVAQPHSPDRAAAISAFLGFNNKPDGITAYFGWLSENLTAKPGCGFDWAIKRETFLRAREGNFSALAA